MGDFVPSPLEIKLTMTFRYFYVFPERNLISHGFSNQKAKDIEFKQKLLDRAQLSEN